MASSPAAVTRDDSAAATHIASTFIPGHMSGCLTATQVEALKGIAIGELLFVVKDEPEVGDYGDQEPGNNEDDATEGEHDNGDEDEQPVHPEASNERRDAVASSGNRDGNGDQRSEDASSSTYGANDGAYPDGGRNGDSDTAPEATAVPTITAAVSAKTSTPPRMFVVTAITRNHKDDVVDITVTELSYVRLAHTADIHSYQIYGNDIVHRHPPDCSACIYPVSITSVLADESFRLLKSPPGDHVRRLDQNISNNSHRQCTTGCSRGWLDNRREGNRLVKNNNSPVLAWERQGGNLDEVSMQRPICPVCIGLPLFKAQETLQHALIATGRVVLTDAMDLQAQLNIRRLALGYSFVQFDERDWGYYFDDLEDGSGDEEGEWAQPYQHWEEAMDPNAYIKTHPATEATIKALPRKVFGKMGGECGVCMEPLQEDSMTIVLPCGHAEHHAECLELWLRQQETCTVCRRVVPAAKEKELPGVDRADEERVSSEDMGWPVEQFEGAGQEDVGDKVEEGADEEVLRDEVEEGDYEEVARDEMDETTDEEGAVDMHPGFPNHGQHAAIADSTVAALHPGLLPFSSWVTEDEDVVMSD